MSGGYFSFLKFIRVNEKEKCSGSGVVVSPRKRHLSRDLNEGKEEIQCRGRAFQAAKDLKQEQA